MARFVERRGADGNRRIYATIRKRGYRTRSGVFDRMADARAWAGEIESAMRLGRYVDRRVDEVHNLTEAIDRYLIEVLPQRRPSTQAIDRLRLTWWHEHFGHLLLRDVKHDRLRPAIKMLRERNNGPASIRRYFSAVGAVTSAAVDWDWLKTKPDMRPLRLDPEPKGRVRYLTKEELVRFLDECRKSVNAALYPAAVLALSTGMRRGELLALTWPQMDLARGWVTLTGDQTKGGESRGFHIEGVALGVMRDYEKTTKVVHLKDRRVFPVPAQHFRRAFIGACKRAGIENFRWHDLRHCTASYMVMAGVDLLTVAKVLGHKSTRTTLRYAHLSDEHVRDATGELQRTLFGGGGKLS